MKVTISGVPGSGKSTVAKLVAGEFGFRHFSAGDFMREIAAKRRLSLLEISKAAEKDRSIDEELDRRTAEIGRKQDDFVMDSRLAYHFIPASFKVFLTVDDKEAARRIFQDIRGRKAGRKVEKESTSLASTLANIRKRKKSEQRRYMKYYKLDPYDVGQYDFVIDTTKSTPEKVSRKIIEAVKGSCGTC